MAAVQNGHHLWLVIVAVLFAAIGSYYYFRVIQAMFFKEALHMDVPVSLQKDKAFETVLIIMVMLTLLIGIYPEIIIGWMYR